VIRARFLALLSYLVALAGSSALGGLVLGLGLGLWSPLVSWPGAWFVDLALLLLFAVQHSGMARAPSKRFWARFAPTHLERSAYAGSSGLVLLLLAGVWQPLPGPDLWRGPTWLVALPLTAAGLLALVNGRFDHAGLFGLRQAWTPDASAPERLLVLGPYRYVRHPLMVCLLVFLWAQPTMTSTLLVLSGGLTVLILVGIQLEDRDLLRRFGQAYADYRQNVPGLIPRLRPAPAGEWMEENDNHEIHGRRPPDLFSREPTASAGGPKRSP
jgi:protein-S-isoprenylcysteine O-methyltransferase Ste14